MRAITLSVIAQAWGLLRRRQLVETEDVLERREERHTPTLDLHAVRRLGLDLAVGVGSVKPCLAEQRVLHDKRATTGVDAVFAAVLGSYALLAAHRQHASADVVVVVEDGRDADYEGQNDRRNGNCTTRALEILSTTSPILVRITSSHGHRVFLSPLLGIQPKVFILNTQGEEQKYNNYTFGAHLVLCLVVK
ncbi:MAG: hypothetical protein JWS12_555 [Candidatus Saccharibacteria bacterium]|nr:hypothetical protein [Candidatus Saccharibacteria bacterium]